MTPDEFWRSTPRIVNLVIAGYQRRRAWAAFHAGYGLMAKNAKIEHLLNRKPKREPMAPDAMLAAVRRIKQAIQKKWGGPKQMEPSDG